jgi:AP endonuclease-1
MQAPASSELPHSLTPEAKVLDDTTVLKRADSLWKVRAHELPHSLTPEAKVLDDTTVLKRADSLWKVGAHVSAAGGMENTVTNAVNMGSVMHRWSCYQTFDLLVTFIRANSFSLFPKSPFQWTAPSLTPQSISVFKMRMEQYGYANDMVLPNSNYLIHLNSTHRFVSTTVQFSVMTRQFSQ